MRSLLLSGLAALAICGPLADAARAQATSGAAVAAPAPASGAAVPGESVTGSDAWRLRPGDAVRLYVGDADSLSNDFPVTEDGRALLPMIGAVRVGGRLFPEVREEILAAYARQLVGLPVLVTPVLRIAVLGEVRQPGLVPVDPTYTVADVLAAAGGVTPLGNPGRIALTGERGALRFSLTDDGGLLAQPLRPGDQIVVPRRSWARENLNVLLGAGASVLAAAVTSLLLR